MTELDRDELQARIMDEISGIQIGSGYYAMTIGTVAAREAADALLPLFAEVWAAGAQWAAVELGELKSELGRWVTDVDNPLVDPGKEVDHV